MRKILVIEDQRDIADLIGLHLRDIPCEVTLRYDGRSGLAEAQSRPHDLVILDVMLPDLDGLAILRELRSKAPYTPIMMVTAKAGELDRVLGLELGADDYLTKPFSVLELVARTRALFRRVEALAGNAETVDAPLSMDGMTIDPTRRTVTVEGRPVDLTSKEFDLLLHFARNPGRVYSRVQLLDTVWGYGYEGYEHNVNCHINRLRAKIERDQAKPKYILTVRGVGYKFSEASPAAPVQA